MNNINAQEYLEKNWTDLNLTQITSEISVKINGDLVIKDYPNLTEIDLPSQELTSLTIINCPLLKSLNVRNNKLIKLDLNKVKIDSSNDPLNNEINEIIAGSNELTELDLTYCSQLKKLLVSDNLYLTNIKNLDFAKIEIINLTNSPQVSLADNYEELKQENANLYEIVKQTEEAGRQRKLKIFEPIRTIKQAEEAIQRHLKKTELEWREYFESEDKIKKENFLLDLNFQDPKINWKAKEILTWIIEAQVSRDYDELIKKWNGGDNYNPTYDFDGSLGTLIEHFQLYEKLTKN